MRKPAETVPVGAWSNFPPRCYEKADTDANKVPYLFLTITRAIDLVPYIVPNLLPFDWSSYAAPISD